MDNFSSYVYGWSDWVVTPIFLVVAIVFHVRNCRTWLLLIAIGLALTALSEFLYHLYPNPLHKLHLIGLVIGITGFAIAVWGGIRWWSERKKNLASE